MARWIPLQDEGWAGQPTRVRYQAKPGSLAGEDPARATGRIGFSVLGRFRGQLDTLGDPGPTNVRGLNGRASQPGDETPASSTV